MDIKKLELFADVAETRNFTRSGDRMGYTQSGVSHILKSLETEIGFPLFVRTKQGVHLTRNAELLLPLVHTLLSANENLSQTIHDVCGVNAGSLVIASFASISIHWLPQIIRRFQELYPDITISLMEGGTDEIVDWVANNQADFGFMSQRNTRGLEWISLCEDPLMAILPRDYPVPEDNRFPIEEFHQQHFIISAMGTDYDVHHALDSSNVKPNTHFTSKDDHAIISMIANHLGISILPQLVVKGYEEQVLSPPSLLCQEPGHCGEVPAGAVPRGEKVPPPDPGNRSAHPGRRDAARRPCASPRQGAGCLMQGISGGRSPAAGGKSRAGREWCKHTFFVCQEESP